MVKELLTRKEASEQLGISVATLDEEHRGGFLAYIQRKPGGKVWITEAAVEEYLARATHPARPEKMVIQAYRKRRKHNS